MSRVADLSTTLETLELLNRLSKQRLDEIRDSLHGAYPEDIQDMITAVRQELYIEALREGSFTMFTIEDRERRIRQSAPLLCEHSNIKSSSTDQWCQDCGEAV